jgi:hypothetical protein
VDTICRPIDPKGSTYVFADQTRLSVRLTTSSYEATTASITRLASGSDIPFAVVRASSARLRQCSSLSTRLLMFAKPLPRMPHRTDTITIAAVF